jgi:sulfur-oxidizing protein SoxY
MRGRRVARLCLLAGLIWGWGLGFQPAIATESDAPWPDIRAALFGEREIQDGAGVIALEAPERAHDAAIVPVRIEALMPQTGHRYIEAITLVIDNNPAPIAGTFHLTLESGLGSIATRVRVDAYTDIRAIAETSDGELYMASRFVKASGGCAAPALKDHEQAMARLGKMKLKHTPFRLGEPNEVQLLISHPNYTGLQIDQLSRNWIPPHFVRTIEVRYDGAPVMTVDGDISISENPSIHFSFMPEAEGELEVEARDSEGGTFSRSWPVAPDAPS